MPKLVPRRARKSCHTFIFGAETVLEYISLPTPVNNVNRIFFVLLADVKMNDNNDDILPVQIAR